MKKLLVLIPLFVGTFGSIIAQPSYEERVTSVSNIGLTVSNLGIIGNSFKGSFQIDGFPSCEYPVNSGIEHMFDGGLWIGAKVDGQFNVTTGALDDASGYSTGKGGFEFSAGLGSRLNTRSSLLDNPNFSPDAISHQDFFCDFTDSNIVVPGTSIPINNHLNPLGVTVHMETYNWNFSFANFFVILNFKITNTGPKTLDSVYAGYWVDFVVRNINITPPGGTAFFNKSGNGYEDSLQMAYEFDALGDTAFTRSYAAIKFLGADDGSGNYHPEFSNDFKVHFNSWQFQNSSDPLFFLPTDDNARYGKMSLGFNHNDNLNMKDILTSLRAAGNRSNFISAGPFKSLAPGQSCNIAFAVICAKTNEDGKSITEDNPTQRRNLLENASWAQRTYNGEDVNFNGVLDPGEDRNKDGKITRFILPSPPDVPQVKVVPSNNKIDLYWTKNAEESIDPISNRKDFEGFRIYKTKFGFDLNSTGDIFNQLEKVAEFDKKGNNKFYETGFEEVRLEVPTKFEGDTLEYYYHYELKNIANGWQTGVALTAFDEGDEANELESLESSPLSSLIRTFAGTPANADMDANQPFAYPNPYYGGAEWEGRRTFEEDRKVVFANLPKRANIRVYTQGGDLIKTIAHDERYTGSDIRWYTTFSNVDKTKFSGGEHAWDLLSNDNQIVARGLYIFTVEDLDSGKLGQGKLMIIR